MICKRFAVFGDPIEHSLSPLIHYIFAKQTGIKLRYDKQCVRVEDFASEVKYFFNSGGIGLNITSPLKELAYKLSDVQTQRCKQAGSANTLWCSAGKIYADNTDGTGLILDLRHYVNLSNKKILIIGAGGAARGIIDAIHAEKPQSISILNRSQNRLFNLINDFAKRVTIIAADYNINYDVIINATPSSAEIISDTMLKQARFCYDLTYKYKYLTIFEQRALKLGVPSKNGLGMLINQASLSFAIWNNICPIISHSLFQIF